MPNSKQFKYPWDELEEFLESTSSKFLSILVYGSLMSPESARKTLSAEVLESACPAIGFGIKRVFNYLLTPDCYERHGEPVSPLHVAALNVVVTNSSDDSVNGNIIQIPFSNLAEFRIRERGYDLIAIPTKAWHSGEEIAKEVFVLSCNPGQMNILPHLNYLKTCESGARSVSEGFLVYFRNSTYLCDGTRLADWTNS